MRSDGMRYAKRKEALTNAIRCWCSYFRYVDAKNNLHAIDEWLRSRIRMWCIWKSWKNNGTRVRNLIKCMVSKWHAYLWENASEGCWAVAASEIMKVAANNRNIVRAGYPTLLG